MEIPRIVPTDKVQVGGTWVDASSFNNPYNLDEDLWPATVALNPPCEVGESPYDEKATVFLSPSQLGVREEGPG